MGLINHDQPTFGPTIANRLDGGGNLCGMVPIVIHQHGLAVPHGIVTVDLKPATNAFKRSQALAYRLVINALFDGQDRKSTRLNSSHVAISYAVLCLKTKKY